MRTFLLVINLIWLFLQTGRAQTFSAQEQEIIIANARKLLDTGYLQNLEILTHYEVNQPFEALDPQLKAFVKSAFRDADVQVFNEFREPLGTLTSIEEYIKDCHIFFKQKPIINTLDWTQAWYQFHHTPDQKPYLNVYVIKKMQGIEKKSQNYANVVECRIYFAQNERLKSFYDFRIAGITRAEKYPAGAFTQSDLKPEEKTNDLFSALDTLTAQLQERIAGTTPELILERFTYRNCGVNDALSDQMFATLNACLQRRVKIPIRSVAEDASTSPVIRGFYEEQGNYLRIRVELRESGSGKLVKTLENTSLPLQWLQEQNISVIPDNYQEVKVVQDTLRQITAVTPPSVLKIEIRTDRGRTGVEYWAGQQMMLEAKANRPCHIRLLYRLADGTQTLLENDFVIRPGQENKLVRIAPEASFICSAPFGTEYLLAYASEQPFCPLPTRPNREGYFRQEGDYQIYVGSLAVFNTLMKCSKSGGITEDHIQITTREASSTK